MNIAASQLAVAFWSFSVMASNAPWADWWAYDGLAGPQHWGYLNTDWVLCRTGKFQSPINIEPRLLLFDPKLRRMSIDIPDLVRGIYKNTGNYLTFTFDDDMNNSANVSDGPLMYTYKMSAIQLHLGMTNSKGSEHRIDGKSFSAEVHIICFNSNLFKSLQEARKKPYGVAIFAIFAETSEGKEPVNSAFSYLTEKSLKIHLQGQEVRLETFNAKGLLPSTDYYITYEGSFTYPGCYETVTWVIFNRPILIHASQLDTIRQLQKRQKDTRMTMMNGNLRPTMPVNNRAIRTNINYHTSGGLCDMKREAFYEVNDILRQ